MVAQVHQFHPRLSTGDAISDHIWSTRRLLAELGYRSEVFFAERPLAHGVRARTIDEYRTCAGAENVLLLHFSQVYSPRVMSWLRAVPDRKVLVYHNITPPSYFEGINPVYAAAARAGRAQLDALASLCEAGWGDSEFNCRELVTHGWRNVHVFPIVLDPRRYAVRPSRRVARQMAGALNVLSVGRTAPNKRLEDVILTFYHLERTCPGARLWLVGSGHGMERYTGYLRALVSALGLRGVALTGHVSTRELVTYYRSATVYLCASEHEGFGVPLVESMHLGVPVVARRAAAVPETLGGAGILITEMDHATVAELIKVIATDSDLRERIVSRQRARARVFYPEAARERLRALLAPFA